MLNNDLKSTGIAVTLEELLNLRGGGIDPLLNKNLWHGPQGPKISNVRGRGIEFEATREYQSGDDIRNMAWRLTARNLKPQVKVFCEEKERAVWFAMDLSPSLYFGTRCMFKSVKIIKKAAEMGWEHLAKRERVGAILATEQLAIYNPASTARSFLNILNALANCSCMQQTFDEKNYLLNLLFNLHEQARAGQLILIFSDFYNFNAEMQGIIAYLARRTQVKLFFVYDPFEAHAPPAYAYQVTNDLKKLIFNMENYKNREHYEQQFHAKQTALIKFAELHNISLELCRTDQ
jgi:uncharacterized protein (DUF58 family)